MANETMTLATDYRTEFADFEGVTYLNAALQGPLPLVAARAAQEALEWKKHPYRLPDSAYFELPDRIREKAARLIGALPDEIAVTTGASAGLAAVAAAIDWKPGDEVLVGRGEFPAHFSTWLRYEQAGKLRVRVVEPRGRFISADDYVEQIGPRTRVVSASLVRFDNGARLDARRVAQACEKVGAALLLDLAQCTGAMAMNIRDLGASMAVCSGYKWFLGPYGTGFFWIASEWIERLPLGAVYFMALEAPTISTPCQPSRTCAPRPARGVGTLRKRPISRISRPSIRRSISCSESASMQSSVTSTRLSPNSSIACRTRAACSRHPRNASGAVPTCPFLHRIAETRRRCMRNCAPRRYPSVCVTMRCAFRRTSTTRRKIFRD